MHGIGVVPNGMLFKPSLISQHTVSKGENEDGHMHSCANTHAQSLISHYISLRMKSSNKLKH